MRTALALSLATVALILAACGGNPGVSSGDDLAAGKELFLLTPSRGEEQFPTCAACHTLDDAGSVSTIGPNLDDAFRTPRAEGFDPNTFEQVVREQMTIPGEPTDAALNNPDGEVRIAMPSVDDYELTDREADNIAFYVSRCAGNPLAAEECPAIIPSEPEAPPPAPPADGGDDGSSAGPGVEAGALVFEQAGCGSCHALAAAGSTGNIGPALDGSGVTAAAVAEIVAAGQGAMPAFAGQLTEEEIRNVAEFVEASAG